MNTVKYELDENNYFTGNYAEIGGDFDKQIILAKLDIPDKELYEYKLSGTEVVHSPEGNPIYLKAKRNTLRAKRDSICFQVINRGRLWYDTLTQPQLEELKQWYRAWLDVTDTMIEPEKPKWLV